MEVGTDGRLGTELLGYRLEDVLGRGGMGVVYRAYDARLKRNVAVKLLASELASDERFRERFLSESQLAAALEHPNVIPIHNAGDAEGHLYLVMRYVEGSDLKTLLREQAPLEPARALAICSQVAAALDAAHAHGLVHRDVKPSNVLLDEREHAYLADFGLTRRLSDQAPGFDAGLSLGTPAYAAPEQIEGKELDGRVDQYSLACLLHECLTGEPPYPRASEAAVLFAHLEEEPPAPPGLEDVMKRALAKDPDDRYETCGELVEAAREALGIREPRPTRWPLAVAAIVVALIAAVLLAFLLTRGSDGPEPLPGADTLVRIDPETNAVAERIPVGREASSVAVGGGYVWVTNTADGNVWRIDPSTRTELRISTQGSPTDIAFAGGSAVVANGPQHSLAVIDGATAKLSYQASLEGGSNGILRVAAGTEGTWFADPAQRTVGRAGETSLRTVPTSRVRIPPNETTFVSAYESLDDLAVGEGAVWVAGDALGRTVWRVDPVSERVTATIDVPFVPRGIAAGEGAVWVSSLLDDTVARIDPTAARITRTIHVGRGASGIAAGRGAVWVANSIDGTVSRIDPRSNEVVATIPVGSNPEEIAAGAEAVWVTTRRRQDEQRAEGVIAVGLLVDCRGRFAQTHDLTLAGAELALIQRGGRLVGRGPMEGVEGVAIGGRAVRLFFGCADGTSASALAEARRLVEDVGVNVLIGPVARHQGLALQDYARRQPEISFVNGTSSAQLLDPAPNFFSFHTDGAQQMAGLGDYAYHELGWRTAVTVADTAGDVYNWAQVAGFVAEFCSLGGTVAKRVWLPPGIQDYSGVIAEIPKADVDGFVVAATPPAVLALARGYPGLRRDLSRRVVLGAWATLGPELAQLGDSMRGIVIAGAVKSAVASSDYLSDFRQAFPQLAREAGNPFDVFYYDAMTATLRALEAVDGDVSGSGPAFMAALSRLELATPNGRTRLDADRQAIAPNYVLQFLGPGFDTRAIRTIPRVERTFGGYFRPEDRPPSKTTPACERGSPPPWARR